MALCIKLVAAWFVPDVPQSVKNKVLEEKYRVLREKMWCGGLRGQCEPGRGPGTPPNCTPTSSSSAKSTDV